MSALHICLSAQTAPVFLSLARRTLPKAPSPNVPLVTVNWSSEMPVGARWKVNPGYSSAAVMVSSLRASAAASADDTDTSCPVAVYLRSASRESSGPSRRRKAPRSMRTSLHFSSMAATEAMVGAPVFSESSPK
eukprot:scaffold302719_cov32-Tisochrysis_lutea.AAC.4